MASFLLKRNMTNSSYEPLLCIFSFYQLVSLIKDTPFVSITFNSLDHSATETVASHILYFIFLLSIDRHSYRSAQLHMWAPATHAIRVSTSFQLHGFLNQMKIWSASSLMTYYKVGLLCLGWFRANKGMFLTRNVAFAFLITGKRKREQQQEEGLLWVLFIFNPSSQVYLDQEQT